jgi:hypothetical protein
VVVEGGNFCLEGTNVDVTTGNTEDENGMIVNQDDTTFITLDRALVQSVYWVGDLPVYFGTCGCITGRLCDYEAVVEVVVDDTVIRFSYATANAADGYTAVFNHALSIPGTLTPADTAAIETNLLAQLQADGCGYIVGSITAAFDGGSGELTLTITGTNVGVGLLYASDVPGPGPNDVAGFTQSNCIS